MYRDENISIIPVKNSVGFLKRIIINTPINDKNMATDQDIILYIFKHI